MSDKQPALGAANITVTLDGHDYVLRPMPGTIKGVSAACEGLGSAMEKVRKSDVGTMYTVIMLGADVQTPKERRRLDERLLATPTFQLVPPLTIFVATLMNGGRPLDLGTDDDDDAGDNKPAPDVEGNE